MEENEPFIQMKWLNINIDQFLYRFKFEITFKSFSTKAATALSILQCNNYNSTFSHDSDLFWFGTEVQFKLNFQFEIWCNETSEQWNRKCKCSSKIECPFCNNQNVFDILHFIS